MSNQRRRKIAKHLAWASAAWLWVYMFVVRAHDPLTDHMRNAGYFFGIVGIYHIVAAMLYALNSELPWPFGPAKTSIKPDQLPLPERHRSDSVPE